MMSQFTTSTPNVVLPQTHSNCRTLSTVWWVYEWRICCLRQEPLSWETPSVTMQTVNQPALSETENDIKVICQCIMKVDCKKKVTRYSWIYLDASWYAAYMIHYNYSKICVFKKQPWSTLEAAEHQVQLAGGTFFQFFRGMWKRSDRHKCS